MEAAAEGLLAAAPAESLSVSGASPSAHIIRLAENARQQDRRPELSGIGRTSWAPKMSAGSLAPTFRCMLSRKMRRRLNGIVTRPSSTHGAQLFWLFAVAIWWLGFVQLDLTSASLEMRFSLGSGVIAASLATLIVLHFALRLAEVIHWMLYWVYSVLVLTLYVALRQEPDAIRDQDGLLARMRGETEAP